MQDPFRPNSNAQLLREAQAGFVVIGLLLCVLVYVAFYRLTNRSSRFDAMAQNVAVAQPVDGDPYLAHTVVKTAQNLEDRLANQDAGLLSALQDFSPLGKPSTSPKTLGDETVAQATYLPRIDGTKVQSSTHVSSQKTATEQSVSAPKPIPHVDRAFEPQRTQHAPAVATEKRVPQKVQVLPPMLKSNFGGSDNQDFRPAAPLTKPDPEVSVSDFAPSIALPQRQTQRIKAKPVFPIKDSALPTKSPTVQSSKTQSLPAKSFPSQPLTTKSASTDSMTTHSRPDVDETTQPLRAAMRPSASLKEIVSKKSDSIVSGSTEMDSKPLIAQTSAFAPVESVASAPMMNTQEYITKRGDSLWTIAQELYGDGRYFRALHEINRQTLALAKPMPVGTILNVATIKDLQESYPELCPKQEMTTPTREQPTAPTAPPDKQMLDLELDQRFYRTEDGDTLFEIARQRLGQASRYLEIYELNRFRIPETANHLTPLGGGIQLLLPQ